MTISSTTRVAGPFTGNGATATFPFAFKAFDPTDLEVVTLNVETGAIATLALETDYTAALNADQDSSPGGSITLTAGPLAAGMTLTITTDIDELQGLDLENGGGFYPDVINDALDLLTILLQQLQVQVGRSLQVPFFDPTTNVTLPPASLRAGALLGFDSSGNLQMVGAFPDRFVATAGQSAFPLTKSPYGGKVLLVTLDGLAQDPQTYSVAAGILTFDFATENGDIVNAIYLA